MTAQNIAHPVITFKVTLELNRNESFGPKTNSSDVGVLHPDRHTSFDEQRSATQGARKDARSALLGYNKVNSSLSYLSIPGNANTMNLKHGDEFTVSGMQAMDIRKKYVSGSWNNYTPEAGLGAVLTIVSSTLAADN